MPLTVFCLDFKKTCMKQTSTNQDFIRVWNVNKAFLKSLLDEGVAKAGGAGIVVYE